MPEEGRSTSELNAELETLRSRVAELEAAEGPSTDSAEPGGQRYRDLVENLNDVIYTIDAAGVMTYISPSVEAFIGYTPSEVIGQPFARFVHKEELPRLRKGFGRLLDGNPSADQYRAVHKSGEVRWMRTSSQPISLDGRVTGVQGVLSDITECKRAEEALAESEERFRELTEALPEAVFETDLKGDLTYVNRRALELFGYGRGDLERGLSALEMIALPERPRALENIRRIIREGEKGAHEYTALARNGQSFPALIHSTPVERNGVVRGLRGVLVDLTERKCTERSLKEAHDQLETRVRERTAELSETNQQLALEIEDRKQAEEALRTSEATLRALLDAPTDAIGLLSADGTVMDCNNTMAELLDLTRERLVGNSVWDLFPEAVAERRKAYVEQVVRLRKPVRFEDEREGRWFDNVMWPIQDDSGGVSRVAVIARDITERKLADEVLKNRADAE
jgi:PAS domain S-box-containing protein